MRRTTAHNLEAVAGQVDAIFAESFRKRLLKRTIDKKLDDLRFSELYLNVPMSHRPWVEGYIEAASRNFQRLYILTNGTIRTYVDGKRFI